MRLSYAIISDFPFQTAIQKLSKAPVSGHDAYKINMIHTELKAARKKISEEYEKELIEPFAVRDEHGKYERESFECMPEKLQEFEKLQEEFGKREIEISRPLLPFNVISGLKLTAEDVAALGNIVDVTDAERPPVPPRTLNLKQA